MGYYESDLPPHVLDCACGMRSVADMRTQIVPQAQGVVLEFAIGSGLNLPLYDASRVTRIIGLDRSSPMMALARHRARGVPFPVDLIEFGGESIPLPDSSVDTVLTTYTLCTMPDPVIALRAMRRVLKPEGRLLFCEHGLASEAGAAGKQYWPDGGWSRSGGGCHPGRALREALRCGGFAIERIEAGCEPALPRWPRQMLADRAHDRIAPRRPANNDAPPARRVRS